MYSTCNERKVKKRASDFTFNENNSYGSNRSVRRLLPLYMNLEAISTHISKRLRFIDIILF